MTDMNTDRTVVLAGILVFFVFMLGIGLGMIFRSVIGDDLATMAFGAAIGLLTVTLAARAMRDDYGNRPS